MPPADQLLRGVDVSCWQGRVDWKVAAASDLCRFAYVKATEGATSADERFAENWAGTLCNGIPRGAYHFLVAGVDPRLQAEHFLATYPGDGELPPALDLEWGARGSVPSAWEAATWLQTVYEVTGVRPIVYTSPGFAALTLAGPEGKVVGEYHDLWVAHYGVRSPSVPKAWSSWRIWQTGKGRVPGFEAEVDLDVMKPTS